jgi:hypothetical protein
VRFVLWFAKTLHTYIVKEISFCRKLFRLGLQADSLHRQRRS